MLGFQQGILQLDIEIIKVYIMQEHVDAAEVVSGRINLLTEILKIRILLTNGLSKLKQQRTRTASRVVNFIDARIIPRSQSGQQLTYLLRCEELATTLTCL